MTAIWIIIFCVVCIVINVRNERARVEHQQRRDAEEFEQSQY
jgi:preprotein translocase subunit SecG